MDLKKELEENKDRLALEVLKKHNEGSGWPIAPSRLANLEKQGYITSEGTITSAGNAFMEEGRSK